MLSLVKEVADINGDKVMMRTLLEQFLVFRRASGRSRALYRSRRDVMLAGLEANMPEGTTWSHPSGGFFVWVTLPEGLNAIKLLPVAVEKFGVAYLLAGATVLSRLLAAGPEQDAASELFEAPGGPDRGRNAPVGCGHHCCPRNPVIARAVLGSIRPIGRVYPADRRPLERPDIDAEL
ncbi:MAG: hypothetical protein R2845_11695 [Thermomicrobiales bacterium]